MQNNCLIQRHRSNYYGCVIWYKNIQVDQWISLGIGLCGCTGAKLHDNKEDQLGKAMMKGELTRTRKHLCVGEET